MGDINNLEQNIDKNNDGTIDVSEIKEFSQDEEKIKGLGEILSLGLSKEISEELEDTLKLLCEEIISNENITDDQQEILNYFSDNYGEKYPDLKDKIELTQIVINCIKNGDIKENDMFKINERNKICGDNFELKDKITKLIIEKIDKALEKINKTIAENKPSLSPNRIYPKEAIMLIQLYANLALGANLTITGERGNIGGGRLGQTENEKLTNIFIYRLEIKTRQTVIDYRESLKLPKFENLLNIPNLDTLLSVLDSKEDQNQVLEEFFNFFLKIKKDGMYFENNIGELFGEEGFECVLYYLIYAKKYQNIPFSKQDAEEGENVPKQISTKGEYYKRKADNLEKAINNKNEEFISHNRILKEQQIMKHDIEIISKINDIIGKIRETTDRQQKKELYWEAYDLSLDINNENNKLETKKQLFIGIRGDFTNTQIPRYFPQFQDEYFSIIKDIETAYTNGGTENITDMLAQLENIQILTNPENIDYEHMPLVFQYGNQNKEGTWSLNSSFPYSTFHQLEEVYQLSIPGIAGELRVSISNDEIKQVNDLLNDANYGRIKLALPGFQKNNTSNFGITKLSLNDFVTIQELDNGDLNLYKIGASTPFKTISKAQQDNARSIESNALRSSLGSKDLENDINNLTSLSGCMESIQKIADKMNNNTLTESDEEYIFTESISLKNQLQNLRDNERRNHSISNIKNELIRLDNSRDQNSLTTNQELQLKNYIKHLNLLEEWLEPDSQIDQFINYMTNAKNIRSNDEWWKRAKNWLKDNLVTIVCAIGIAVLVVCAIPSGGTSLVGAAGLVSFLGTAAAMTAGGMVGARIGQYLNERLRDNVFTTTIEINGKPIQIHYDDPTDLELVINGDLEPGEFFKKIGLEFLIGTASTAGFMFAGKVIGGRASKAIISNPESKLSLFLKKVPFSKLKDVKDPYADDLFAQVAQNGKQSFWKRFGTEFAEELREESSETAGEQLGGAIDKTLGYESVGVLGSIISIRHSLSPNGRPKIYGDCKVRLDGMYGGNHTIGLNLTFDANIPNAKADLIGHFQKNGFTLNLDGTLSKPNDLKPEYSVVISLIPSNVPDNIRVLSNSLSEYGIHFNHNSEGEAYYTNELQLNEWIDKVEKSGKGIIKRNYDGSIDFVSGKHQIKIKPLFNKINNDANDFEIPLKNGKCEYTSAKTGKPVEDITKEQAKECFFNGLDVTAQLMEGQFQWSVLSSGSLFLNNPKFMKLGGDIDVATDVQTFRNVALEKGPNGKTKLDQFRDEGTIKDLIFTRIDHTKLTIEGDTAIWIDKEGQQGSCSIEDLIAKGDIRVEFNIPSKDGFMINCEFFPEPEGYGLIQLGTTRTEGKVNTYTINGREVKTVNEELAAMSYMINLAHEFKNNTFNARKDAIEKGDPIPKLKDSVRINNFLQYLSSIGLETPNDIIEFIDKTKSNYEKQKGEEFTINENGETKTINMSKYLKDGLDNLGKLREILVKVESDYKTILKTERDSRGTETNISFNQFMSNTYNIKQRWFDGFMTYEEATIEIEKLKTRINISDPKNFAYYYEIYQLQNFIKAYPEI